MRFGLLVVVDMRCVSFAASPYVFVRISRLNSPDMEAAHFRVGRKRCFGGLQDSTHDVVLQHEVLTLDGDRREQGLACNIFKEEPTRVEWLKPLSETKQPSYHRCMSCVAPSPPRRLRSFD